MCTSLTCLCCEPNPENLDPFMDHYDRCQTVINHSQDLRATLFSPARSRLGLLWLFLAFLSSPTGLRSLSCTDALHELSSHYKTVGRPTTIKNMVHYSKEIPSYAKSLSRSYSKAFTIAAAPIRSCPASNHSLPDVVNRSRSEGESFFSFFCGFFFSAMSLS